jgi:hypothetical protein
VGSRCAESKTLKKKQYGGKSMDPSSETRTQKMP